MTLFYVHDYRAPADPDLRRQRREAARGRRSTGSSPRPRARAEAGR